MSEETQVDYICPLSQKPCFNYMAPERDPFSGDETYKLCAFGTKDGACSIARLISTMNKFFTTERW